MASREEIQKDIEIKLDQGQQQVDKLKLKMEAAGDDASHEWSQALLAAEKQLAAGKAKYEELAAASDEKFNEMWAASKDNWEAFTADFESGWDSLSRKVKDFFS